jgi:NitT/TauT family transport system substrate-binding protein
MRLALAGLRRPASRIMLALTAVALLAAGCTSGSEPSAHGSITVALVPGVDNAPLRLAVSDGLFRKHGLDITVSPYSSLAQAVQAVHSGQADMIGGDYADLLYADTHNQASLRLVADAYDAVPNLIEILTWPGSGITTPQDLVGKTVATPAQQLIPYKLGHTHTPYSMETLAAQAVLQSDAVSPTSVKWITPSGQGLINELSSHQVAAILVSEPQVFEAESQLGATEVLDAASGVTAGLPLSGYFASTSFASKNSNLLAAFRSVLSTAQQSSGTRGPVEAALRSTASGLTAQDAAMMTIGSYPTFLSVGQVQRVATAMYTAGLTNTKVSMQGITSGG